jgi:hypothetical protein
MEEIVKGTKFIAVDKSQAKREGVVVFDYYTDNHVACFTPNSVPTDYNGRMINFICSVETFKEQYTFA